MPTVLEGFTIRPRKELFGKWIPVVGSAGSESYLRSVPTRYARLVAEAIAEQGGAKRISVDTFADSRAYQELQTLTPRLNS